MCAVQGGANAGHTIYDDKGTKFALHLVPSGILHKQAMCLVGNGVVVHLPGLFEEIETLAGQGVSVDVSLSSVLKPVANCCQLQCCSVCMHTAASRPRAGQPASWLAQVHLCTQSSSVWDGHAHHHPMQGRLMISDRAHLLFDLHKEIDGLREAELAGGPQQDAPA